MKSSREEGPFIVLFIFALVAIPSVVADNCDDIFIGTSNSDYNVVQHGYTALEFSSGTTDPKPFTDLDIVPGRQFYIKTDMGRP